MSASNTVVPLEGVLIEKGIVSLDARSVRLALSWSGGPLCCAHGVAIDARSKMVLARKLPDLAWSPEGPILDDAAPSGVFEKLAERDGVCGANDGDPVRGEGCRIRGLDPKLLPPGCALFPLDVVQGVLTLSSRIPESSLVESSDSIHSLWDDARPRFLALYGEEATKAVDGVAEDVRAHRTRKLHLKTLR